MKLYYCNMGFVFLLAIIGMLETTGQSAPERQQRRLSGDGEIADFVLEETDDTITGWVAEKPSNAPMEGGKVSLLVDGAETPFLMESTTEPGKYRLSAEGSLKFREVTTKSDTAVQAVIENGELSDIIPLAVEEGSMSEPVAEGAKPNSEVSKKPWVLASTSVAVGFLLGALGFYLIFRTRIRWSKAAMYFVFGSGLAGYMGSIIISPPAMAHEGHEHAVVPGADSAGSVGGVVRLNKSSQFLLGVRSVNAEKRVLRESVVAYGHLHPKPQLDALLVAPQPGFIRVAEGLTLGAKVRKGQVLGYLDALARIALVSPVDGDIQEMEAVTGSRVEAGAKLFRVSDVKKLWIDAEVYESDVGRIPENAKVEVVVEGIKAPVPGILMTNRSPISEETRTAKHFVEIDNSDGKLRLGTLVSVYFILSVAQEGISLPKNAIVSRGGDQVVIIQTGPETFRPQTVLVQRSSEPGEVRILSGLAGDERVVVSGNYQLLSKAK